MEACAENKKQMVVLDRPNPNGHYVDGPVLEPQFKSFCRNASSAYCLRHDHWRICHDDQR